VSTGSCLSGWGLRKAVVGGVVPGTLLGPEGSGVLLPRFFSAGLACFPYRLFLFCVLGGSGAAGAPGGVPPVF